MIKIHDIGSQFVNAGGININRPNGSGDYLLLFLRTDAEIMAEDDYTKIEKESFYFFPKGGKQIYKKEDGAFINDWIHFDIEPYDNYFEKLLLPFYVPVKLYEHAVINDMTYDLFAEFFNSGEHHDMIMSQKADALFHKLSDIYNLEKSTPDAVNKYRAQFTKLRQKIFTYEMLSFGVEEIARNMNMSTSYFEHLYKSIFKTSIIKDIIKARIGYACILIDKTDYSITQIAEECGYRNLEHFSRQFKAIMGCSPKKYRRHERLL